jgi:membrane protein
MSQMARMCDIPRAVRQAGLWTLIKRIVNETSDDHLVMWAAALAYSWLFAIFPFLIFLLSLIPLLPDAFKASVLDQINNGIHRTLPTEAADVIWNNTSMILAEILTKPLKSLISVALLGALWGASSGLNTTISAIEKCYDIDRGRPFYRQRPLAILLTFVVAALILSLILILPVGTLAIHWIESNSYSLVSWPIVMFWKIVRIPLALILMFSILHVMYHHAPFIRQKRVYFTPGALFCVVVWTTLMFAFRYYVDHFAKFNQTYGTVGGVAILLLVFYLDALVLLIGAEINSEIDFEVLQLPRGTRDFTATPPAAANDKQPENAI